MTRLSSRATAWRAPVVLATFGLALGISPSEAADGAAGASTGPELETLAPITVTAKKREQDLQEVPASVTVLDAGYVEDFDVNDTYDVFNIAPNVFMTRTGPPGAFTTFGAVRGIASSMGNSPAIGFFVDDVYRTGLDINLQDVERIEVSRGPQGSLYGRNTEAGVVNVITKAPTDTWESEATVGYARFSTLDASAAAGGPLVEGKAAIRLSGRYRRSDGYYERRDGSADDIGAYDQREARLRLDLFPTDALTASVTLDVHDYPTDNYLGFAPLDSSDRRTNIDVNHEGSSDKDLLSAAVRLEYDTSNAQIVSISSVLDEEFRADIDADFTPVDLFRLDLARDTRLFNQEFRYVSARPDSPFNWLIGANLFFETTDNNFRTSLNFDNFGFPGLGIVNIRQNSTTETIGTALFGEATYELDNGLSFTAGLRLDREHQEFDYEQRGGTLAGYPDLEGSEDRTSFVVLPKGAIGYAFNEDLQTYASISRGFRSGGFNQNESIGSSFEPEFTLNYEVGVKSQWFDQRLQVNASAFYIDWTNRQVEVLIPGGTAFFIENAGGATSRGVELEVAARPLPGLELFGTFGYTKATYRDYVRAGTDVDGNDVIDYPAFTANLSAIYRHDSGAFIGGSFRSVGKVFFNVENTESQDAYHTLDLRAGYEIEDAAFEIFATNIFDEEYVTRAGPSVGGRYFGLSGEPRTIGGRATVRF